MIEAKLEEVSFRRAPPIALLLGAALEDVFSQKELLSEFSSVLRGVDILWLDVPSEAGHPPRWLHAQLPYAAAGDHRLLHRLPRRSRRPTLWDFRFKPGGTVSGRWRTA